MRIGSLNRRISIESPTRKSDGMGGWEILWKEMASDVACAIWPISALEQIKSQGVVMTSTHRIRMRYRSDLRSNYRLKYKNDYFNIVSIINTNMANKVLDIIVKAV